MKDNSSSLKKTKNIDSLGNSLIVATTCNLCRNNKVYISELDSLEKEEQRLLVQRKHLLDTLDELQSKFEVVSDKKRHLLAEMERNIVSKQQNTVSESSYKLFSIITWGSSWTDGLVFTVLAENDVWAKEVVRQWLNSNGRENHRIDKVMALVSRDVRAIVNVGAQLLDV